MNEQTDSYNNCGYRPHAGRFIPLIVSLAIGFMLGMRKGMLHRGAGHGKTWENGVPPFFAELHRRAHAAEEQPPVTEA